MTIHRTDHNPAAELRDLIDQLTRPHDRLIEQEGRHLGTRRDQPLLTKLATARTANIGAGHGNTAAHERSTLNANASELYTAIQKRVRQWATAADVPRYWTLTASWEPVDWRDPAALLRAWHTRTLADPHFNPDPHTQTLRAWVSAICDLVVDPPRKWALEDPCPLCQQRWAITGHDRTDALNVIERDPADNSQILCRNCGATWNGIAGARQLRSLLATNTIPVQHQATA